MVILSGKLICGNCGRSFGVGSTKTLQTGAIRRSYRCRTRVDNGIITINEKGEEFGCNADIIYEDEIKVPKVINALPNSRDGTYTHDI